MGTRSYLKLLAVLVMQQVVESVQTSGNV